MSPDRVEELEVRYSHLEKAHAELSEVVWRQQQALDGLTERVRQLTERLAGDPGLVETSRDDRPPHY
jgi:uncharacterized coiled-coil protein SlyX